MLKRALGEERMNLTSPEARILLVDPSRAAAELAGSALADVAQVERAATAELAIARLAREPFDLVVGGLEHADHGLDGVLAAMGADLPDLDWVLVLPADAPEPDAGIAAGGVEVLREPLRPEVLRIAVDRIVKRRRLVEENQRLRSAVSTLQACRVLSPCLEVGEVYALALELLLESLARTRGIALFNRSSLAMSDSVAFRGFSESQAVALREILVSEKPVEVDRIGDIDETTHGAVFEAFARAQVDTDRVLTVPIRSQTNEAGVLWLLGDGRRFDEGDWERAALVSQAAGTSLENAVRYHLAKEKAFIDDVTELHNARYLHSAIEHEIRRAERYHTPLSVLFLDLDHFKQVNDRRGHLVGSHALRELGSVLAGCVREVDTVARYGGDEFTILLADTDHGRGVQVAERIRRQVAEHSFDGGRQGPISLTVCVGVATYPDHGADREQVLGVADKAMYRAKSLGRNRVCGARELASKV